MWIGAEVKSVTNDDTQKDVNANANFVTAGILISDTGETRGFQIAANDLTSDRLGQILQAKLDALNQRDTAKPTVTVGPVVLKPPPDNSAQVAFQLAARKVFALKQLVDLGIAGPKELEEAAATAKALYQPEFV